MKRKQMQTSKSTTIWIIGIAVVVLSLAGLIIWLQSLHH